MEHTYTARIPVGWHTDEEEISVTMNTEFRLVPFPGIAEFRYLHPEADCNEWQPINVCCDWLAVYPQRRKPCCEEERLILMGLTFDDATGWGAYADWLDEHAEGGKIKGRKRTVAQLIRYQLARLRKKG